MSQPSGKPTYIPPFSGVRLVECRDHFQLVPVPDVRTVFGYGKIKASAFRIDEDDPESEQMWTDLSPTQEIWAVMQWYVFADGHQEPGNINYLRPDCSEAEVKESMERMVRFENMSREELLGLTTCFDGGENDRDFIDDKHPNYQSEPDPSSVDEYDVYHARLKVIEELQPKTVELIKIANATKDPTKKQVVEREAVQSFYAELAHYFTEDEILAWQKSNPVGTGWMCEFAEVMSKPRRQLDPVNHELALNWLRERYNFQTAKELSESIFRRILRWFTPDAIKKRRERLGLTTKRKPGSPEQ
jgi:hypothetical protein